MPSVDHFCAQLKARGRRVTPQRRAIIQALLDDHSHPTAEQVLTSVRRVMPDISYDASTPRLRPEHAHGFQVIDHSVAFRGYCPACASREEGQDGPS